jgi:hypothetical protein
VLPPLAAPALPELVFFTSRLLKKHFQLSTVNCPLMKLPPLAAPAFPELVFSIIKEISNI